MKPAHAAIPHAVPRRATAARGFSLLEVAVVLVLVLAIAAIALPVAMSWFSDAADERTLEAVTLAIRDEQLEAMMSRTPRAVWISPRSVPSSLDAMPVDAAARQAPVSAAWSLGGEALTPPPSSVGDPSAASSPSSSAAGPGGRRTTLDLPRGWTLMLERPTPAATSAGDGADSTAAVPFESADEEPTRVAVYWPGGQVEVVGTLLVRNADGDAWEVGIDPWTGVPSWRARSSMVDEGPVADDTPVAPTMDASP